MVSVLEHVQTLLEGQLLAELVDKHISESAIRVVVTHHQLLVELLDHLDHDVVLLTQCSLSYIPDVIERLEGDGVGVAKLLLVIAAHIHLTH